MYLLYVLLYSQLFLPEFVLVAFSGFAVVIRDTSESYVVSVISLVVSPKVAVVKLSPR